MGIKRHDDLQEPADETKIWRYMDLGKYLDMVTTETLVMPSAEMMHDTHEGQVGQANLALPIPAELILEGETEEQVRGHLSEFRRRLRGHTYLSCWHAADRESAGMWQLYGAEGKGVAIVSTWGRLKAALRPDVIVYGGRVTYVDYRVEPVPEENGLSVYCYKRSAFDHEREVRLISQNQSGPHAAAGLPHPEVESARHRLARKEGVLRLPADLSTLIEELWISPDAAPWFAKMVSDVTARYGGTWPIVHSDLYQLR